MSGKRLMGLTESDAGHEEVLRAGSANRCWDVVASSMRTDADAWHIGNGNLSYPYLSKI